MASDPLPYARPRPGTQPPVLYPDYASTQKRAPKRAPLRVEHTLSETTG
ncbi:MAG: protocatechuate 3,4-dioxygenase subunit beta, partial [Alphaproteobacteria bacterium]